MVELYSCLFKENGKVTDVSKITLILLIYYVPKKNQQNNLVVEMKKELCKSEEADGRRQRVERTIERPLTYPNVKLASSHGVIF